MNTLTTLLNLALIFCSGVGARASRANCYVNSAGTQITCNSDYGSLVAHTTYSVLRALDAHFRGLRPSYLLMDFLYHAIARGPDAVAFPVGSGLHVHRVTGRAHPNFQQYALFDDWISTTQAACTIELNSNGPIPFLPTNYSSFESLDHASGELGFQQDAYAVNGAEQLTEALNAFLVAQHHVVPQAIAQNTAQAIAPAAAAEDIVEQVEETLEAIAPIVEQIHQEAAQTVTPHSDISPGPIQASQVHLIQAGSATAELAETSVCNTFTAVALATVVGLLAYGMTYLI